MADRLAITKNTALKIFWDNGFNTELLLHFAISHLEELDQATDGYLYADDVVTSCEEAKKSLEKEITL